MIFSQRFDVDYKEVVSFPAAYFQAWSSAEDREGPFVMAEKEKTTNKTVSSTKKLSNVKYHFKHDDYVFYDEMDTMRDLRKKILFSAQVL